MSILITKTKESLLSISETSPEQIANTMSEMSEMSTPLPSRLFGPPPPLPPRPFSRPFGPPPPLPPRTSIYSSRPIGRPPLLPPRPIEIVGPVRHDETPEPELETHDETFANRMSHASFLVMTTRINCPYIIYIFEALGWFFGRNKLSFPLCHGILVGSFFLFSLISLAAGSSDGLYYAIGIESEEFRMADSIDKIIGCRWESLGVGLSATLSVFAIFFSFIPFMVSTFLIKKSSDGCKSAFKVNRFPIEEELIPTSNENMNEVRRISFLVKMSYLYTGLPILLLILCTGCDLVGVSITISFCVFLILMGVWNKSFKPVFLSNYSRLNNVLSPSSAIFYYSFICIACIALAANNNGNSPLAVYGIFVWFFGAFTLDANDFGGTSVRRVNVHDQMNNIFDSIQVLGD